MYGDLLLDRLVVKFLGPAPLHLELLRMLTSFHWNALGSTLGWWFCLLGRSLGRRKQIFGNPVPFGTVPCKIQLVPKTVSHAPHTTDARSCKTVLPSRSYEMRRYASPCSEQNRFPRGADEHHTCPREKHGCVVKFHFSESEQNVLP